MDRQPDRQLPPSPLALLAPSVLTLSALCCGMTSIREAARGEFSASLFWLGVSAIFDGLDGHVARRLNAVTLFGGELDSLCDLVDFGAAPALIVFEWATQIDRARAAAAALDGACAADVAAAGALRRFGGAVSEEGLWACCLVYVSCAAYRLARFNVGALTVVPVAPPSAGAAASPPPASLNGAEPTSAPPLAPPRAPRASRDERGFSAPRVDLGGSQAEGTEAFSTTYVSRAKFFRGVPAPQGALMVVAPVVLALRRAAERAGHGGGGGGGGGRLRADAWSETWPFPPWLSAQTLASVWLLLIGCLMVLTWPMLSSKMAMRDPATESHIRSRSALTLAGKVAAGAVVAWVLISVRSWSYIALTLCAGVEVALALSVPLGPIVYHLAAR